MTEIKKSKLIKTILLLLSTLLWPFQIVGIFLVYIPNIYISFVVPYLIWKMWLSNSNQKMRKIFLILKLPVIAYLALSLYSIEFLLLFMLPYSAPLAWEIVIFFAMLLIARCVIYAMIMFIWQPSILKSFKFLGIAFVLLYCISVACFYYNVENAPDTDGYDYPLPD